MPGKSLTCAEINRNL